MKACIIMHNLILEDERGVGEFRKTCHPRNVEFNEVLKMCFLGAKHSRFSEILNLRSLGIANMRFSGILNL
jgi:hypothetical protein